VSTGSLLVFSDQMKPLFLGLSPTKVSPKLASMGSGSVDWGQALSSAQARFPDAKIRLVIWPQAAGKPVTIRLRQPGEWHSNGRTLIYIDPATSKIKGLVDSNHLGGGERLWNAVWPLHAAKIGSGFSGRIVDIATALTGIGLAALGAYGMWAFLLRKSHKRHLKTLVNLAPQVLPFVR
jgi:uncharacterized iron-regulated membrane protein